MKTRSLIFGTGGFTLTELLVSLAIVGLVVGGLGSMIVTGQRHYMMGSGEVEAQQNVRIALDRMLRDVRDAGYSPTGSYADCAPAPCIDAIVNVGGNNALPTSTAFMIKNDWDGDGQVQNIAVCVPNMTPPVGVPPVCPANNTLRGEWIRYAIAGSTLTRQEAGVDNAPVVLVAGITTTGIANPFQYQNQAVTPAAAPVRGSDITTLIVTLQTKPESNVSGSATAGNVRVRMNDSIRLRNK